MKIEIEYQDKVIEGYEVDTDFTGGIIPAETPIFSATNEEVFTCSTPLAKIPLRIPLRKKFAWPEWLDAAAIATDEDGATYVYKKIPECGKDYWHGKVDSWKISQLPFRIDLPKFSDWRKSLIVNPKYQPKTVTPFEDKPLEVPKLFSKREIRRFAESRTAADFHKWGMSLKEPIS